MRNVCISVGIDAQNPLFAVDVVRFLLGFGLSGEMAGWNGGNKGRSE